MSELLDLPVEKKIALVEALWDSIAADSDQLGLTEQQRVELDRRLARLEAEGPDQLSAVSAIAEIRDRL